MRIVVINFLQTTHVSTHINSLIVRSSTLFVIVWTVLGIKTYFFVANTNSGNSNSSSVSHSVRPSVSSGSNQSLCYKVGLMLDEDKAIKLFKTNAVGR